MPGAYWYSSHGAVIESDLPLPELRAADDHPRPTIAIERRPAGGAAGIEWFQRWMFRRRVWMSIGRFRGEYVVRFRHAADFHLSADGTRIRYVRRPGVPPDTLRHLLIDQVLPLALQCTGRLVLHASAVHLPGFGAIGFVGRTAAGKSSLAAAMGMAGCAVIADDALVFPSEPVPPVVAAAYPGLRLWRDIPAALGTTRDARTRVSHYSRKKRMVEGTIAFRHGRSPLRVLFVLGARHEGSPLIRTVELTGPNKVVALTRCTFLLDAGDRSQVAHVFGRLGEVAASVPVVRLRVRNDASQLAAVGRAVRAEARRVAAAGA